MSGISGSSLVLMVSLLCSCFAVALAETIVSDGHHYEKSLVPLSTPTLASETVELLLRFEQTYGIHGLQLPGRWNGTGDPGSSSPVSLDGGGLVFEGHLSVAGHLVSDQFEMRSFAPLRVNIWQQPSFNIDGLIGWSYWGPRDLVYPESMLFLGSK